MKIARTLVTATVLALVLSSCAPQGPGDVDSADSAPTPFATPDPDQERETGLVPPAQVFGGDCSALFTAEEVSALMGLDMALTTTPVNFVEYFPYVEQYGGISCRWMDETWVGEISVIAFPSPTPVTYSASTGCDVVIESAYPGCSLEANTNGIQLSGAVFRYTDDSAARKQAQVGLLDLFAERAKDAASVPVPIPAEGAWEWPTDCTAVVAAGDFSAVPGFESGASGLQTGGSGAYFPVGEREMWGPFVPPYCSLWNGSTVDVTFFPLGGGRWTETRNAGLAGASEIEVAGLDRVILSPADYGLTQVDAYSGPNWVRFSVKYSANAGVLAQALVDALDTTMLE